MAARTRARGARGAVEPLSHGGPGRRPGDRAAPRRRLSRARPRGAAARSPTSVAQRLVAERSVEIERLRYGMEARERERTRWAREIHDETIQGIGALRLRLANARDLDDQEQLREAVDAVLEGLGNEIDGLRHLITELRPAALDDLGLAAALEALARRAQAIEGLDVEIEIELGHEHDGRRAGRRAREHDLPRRAGGADERQPPRRSHAAPSSASPSATASSRASVTDDGKGLPERRPARPARGRAGGRLRHGRHARARRAGRRRARVRPGAGKGTTVRLTVPLAGRPRPRRRRRQRATPHWTRSPAERHGYSTRPILRT